MTLTWLIILLAIALALAPLLHFMPSKRQREVARLREYAAVHGLFVEFRNPPGTAAAGRTAGGSILYYGRRLPPAREKTIGAGAWRRDGDVWRPVARTALAAPPPLPLPADVQAASVDEHSCGVYWREAEGIEGAESICRLLEAWAAALRP